MISAAGPSLPGSKPLVVGAARSGLAAARLLHRLGAQVCVCDARPAPDLSEATRALEGLDVERIWGRDDPALLEDRDCVIWSPGIPVTHPLAVAARALRLPLLSELELAFRVAHARFVCVTGTNGKSTTTDLIGSLIRGAGREVEVCGNIGRAACEVAADVGPKGWLVVEVSSFQLETVDQLKPHVATWLNLTPDHLDRHADLATYGALKQRLFARQDAADTAVWNADDPEVMARRTGGAASLFFSTRTRVSDGAFATAEEIALARQGEHRALMPISDLRLRGRHNLANALAALASVQPLGIAPEALRRVLSGYAGLEHRLEPVAIVDGIEFVNDSKATNVGSLEVALQSFDGPVVLIAGGRDKGQDFRPLASLAAQKVARAVLIGEGAERIWQAWPEVAKIRVHDLEIAVDAAFLHARHPWPGSRGARTVLLSPGCASFDMFEDFEDRGRRFKVEVERLRVEGVVS